MRIIISCNSPPASPGAPGRWPGVYPAPPRGRGPACLPSSPPCSLGIPSEPCSVVSQCRTELQQLRPAHRGLGRPTTASPGRRGNTWTQPEMELKTGYGIHRSKWLSASSLRLTCVTLLVILSPLSITGCHAGYCHKFSGHI